jgi:dienelactone hydrolase
VTSELEGFTEDTFTADGTTKRLLRGGSGPAVIVISEMPGITPGVLGFARRVVDLGCTATLPVLFGEPGRELSVAYGMRSILGGCVSREFSTMALRRTSPVTTWLRALARHEHERAGGPGVGVVGMCFTGGFALGMMVDDTVLAPVLSQPSLPFPVNRKHKADIGISDADLAKVKARDVDVLGLRFTCDKLSPGERFETLRRELGDRFVGVEIDSSPGNPHGIPKNAHSVLTEHLVDEPGHPTHDALQQVLDLFRTKLLA